MSSQETEQIQKIIKQVEEIKQINYSLELAPLIDKVMLSMAQMVHDSEASLLQHNKIYIYE